ncbi:hypothetical protein KSP40_PGU017177 [Platanthera guangdongensis]|uniref:Pentatricopeptide repeat-containing protein n=1 Tax=Platanthera guangdongensis TaxID=2320717 RepID=A0ABR2MXA4_9ASPA
MVETQTLGFLRGTAFLSFRSGALVCYSSSFQASARTPSRISHFYCNGYLVRKISSSFTIPGEVKSSGEAITQFEIIQTSSAADIFARLSLVLKQLSMRRPAHASLDIGCKPNRQNPIAYNMLMKAFMQAGNLDEVLRLSLEMLESNCNPNVYCYNTVMNALVEANRPTEAASLFKEMISNGVAINVASYNILVKLYSFYLKDFEEGYKVIAMMIENDCCPDLTTHCTMITGLCRSGRVEEAMGYLCWMLEEKYPLDAYTYTPIVHSYCSKGKIKEAKQLMDDMESRGYPPNSVTFNILVGALCKFGSFEEVEKVLEESSLKCWKPDEITFNTYMDGLCKYGRVNDAYEKLDMMLINGICPSKVTLNILLDCLCHELRFSEAMCLLDRSPDLEWYPGVIGYNTVMCRLCKDGRWSIVLKLFVDMLKKGIAHNTRTLNIVIDGLCMAGKVHQAKCIMDNRGFIADVTTYNTLIHWLFQLGKLNEAFQMFYNMHVEKINPDLITHTIMVHGLCKGKRFLEAIDYFLISLKDEFALDVYVCLINKLLHHSRYKEILSLFDGMVRESWCLNSIVFYATIDTFCRKGFCHNTKIFVVCVVLEKMLFLLPGKKFR